MNLIDENSQHKGSVKDNGLPQNREEVSRQREALQSEAAKKQDVYEGRFPVYAFPEPIQHIINQTSEALNFPKDYMGSAMLYAASVATGNTLRVEYSTFRQTSAVLYMALVGRPGINKSQPLEIALKPIEGKDKKVFREYQDLLRKYDSAIKNPSKDDEPATTEPTCKKYIVSDFTIEALTKVHSNNLRGIGVYCDELATWFKNFDRYKAGGSDQEFWLATWTGSPLRIDRKKDRPLFIGTPFISVSGTIQPNVLRELGKNDRNQNGFIDRMLFAYPADFERQPWSETELDPNIGSLWQTILNRILDLELKHDQDGQPEPSILKLSPEAKELIKSFQAKNTEGINETSDDAIRSLLSKFDFHVLRLALLLEMLAYGAGLSELMEIQECSARGAIELCKYFISTAKRVNAIISPKCHPIERHPTNYQSLYQQLPDEFSADFGLDIAIGFGISRSALYRFLDSAGGRELFHRTRRGIYAKIDHSNLGQPGQMGQPGRNALNSSQ